MKFRDIIDNPENKGKRIQLGKNYYDERRQKIEEEDERYYKNLLNRPISFYMKIWLYWFRVKYLIFIGEYKWRRLIFCTVDIAPHLLECRGVWFTLFTKRYKWIDLYKLNFIVRWLLKGSQKGYQKDLTKKQSRQLDEVIKEMIKDE